LRYLIFQVFFFWLTICFDKCDQIPGTSNGKTIYVFNAKLGKSNTATTVPLDLKMKKINVLFRYRKYDKLSIYNQRLHVHRDVHDMNLHKHDIFFVFISLFLFCSGYIVACLLYSCHYYHIVFPFCLSNKIYRCVYTKNRAVVSITLFISV
jgi:hypothetical protein